MYKRWFASKRGVFLCILGAFFSGLGIYYVQHLETDPLTHRKRFILLNKQQQDYLAKLNYAVYLKEHQHNLVPKKHPACDRIMAIINNLLHSNKNLPILKEHKWVLTLVNDDTDNAAALPGGHIVASSGVLNMVENDDQLAYIFSHEIAHILLNHSIEKISHEVIVALFLVVPLTAIWAMYPIILAFFVQLSVKVIIDIFLSLPYRRWREMEADVLGLCLAAKACVDVREAALFWEAMKALEMDIEPAEIPWLSTHPTYEVRAKLLDANLQKALKIRLQSGCMDVNRNHPSKRFKELSLKERKAILEAREYLPDVDSIAGLRRIIWDILKMLLTY